VLYRQETVHGEQEEAYKLCKKCLAPRCEAVVGTEHACPHPGAARYGLSYYCEKHMEEIHAANGVYYAHEAIHYLKRWQWITRIRANYFLQIQLCKALSETESQLRHAERELEEAREETEG
jgi:hypothetical protein